MRGLAGRNHGVGGGGAVAAAEAGRARDGQRRARDAEEGEEVEEQRPGHDAGRDAQRPPQGRCPGAAEAAAHRGPRRALLLGHGGPFAWLLWQARDALSVSAGLAACVEQVVEEVDERRRSGRYRVMA